MTGDLGDAIRAYTDANPGANGLWPTEIPGLHLIRGDRETALQHAFYDRALIVVVQGAKEVLLGDARFAYTAGQYLVMSVALPVLASITDARDDRPYLAGSPRPIATRNASRKRSRSYVRILRRTFRSSGLRRARI